MDKLYFRFKDKKSISLLNRIRFKQLCKSLDFDGEYGDIIYLMCYCKQHLNQDCHIVFSDGKTYIYLSPLT